MQGRKGTECEAVTPPQLTDGVFWFPSAHLYGIQAPVLQS
jgi:hypothetical protein